MEVMAVFVISVLLFVAGFVSWYTMWHLRLRAKFEKVPVADGRCAHVVRRNVPLGGDGR